MKKTKAIILITCDELTREALSCYDNQAIETLNLDRLRREATEFTNMYTTSPWCLPARCSLLTGQYPHQNGAYSNFRPCPLDIKKPNLFRLLKEEHYHISMFGKCHFAPVPYEETVPDRTLPYEKFRTYYENLGIDHLVLQDDKQVSVWFYDDYAKEMEKSGNLSTYRELIWDREKRKVFPFPAQRELHPDYWVGQRAADYIRDSKEDYLFSWISFSGPHYPFDPPKEYLKQVKREEIGARRYREGEFMDKNRIHHSSFYGEDGIDGCGSAPGHACRNYTEAYWGNLRASYLANVKLIDDMVGRILEAVEAKFGENTLIVFTADHGEMFGNHGLWGKNNCAYEDVWHIPLFVKFPGQREGMKRSELVNTTDILPTCLEAARSGFTDVTGQSLYHPVKRDVTFAEGEGYIAATDGKYKYVHVQQGEKNLREFLDLSEDPGEYKNGIWEVKTLAGQAYLKEKVIEHLLADALP